MIGHRCKKFCFRHVRISLHIGDKRGHSHNRITVHRHIQIDHYNPVAATSILYK